ncbi:MAG: hypothetical protein JOY79_01340 [Acidobacteriaceae bacterium]|nr:hypothetical protein [Acidobacteriaceae bacterium]
MWLPTTFFHRVADLQSGKLYDEFKCDACGEIATVSAPDDSPSQPD